MANHDPKSKPHRHRLRWILFRAFLFFWLVVLLDGYFTHLPISDVGRRSPGEVVGILHVHTRVSHDGGGTLEVGIVGREGMAGMSVFMGVKTSPNRVLVQGAGSALRMKASTLRTMTENDGSLSRLLRRYSYSLWAQLSQSSVCNLYHPIDARLARWLLMTRDRMEANEFRITQEFLSSMLGVRREGVNKAAGNLQQQHLISYSRGMVTILKPAGLAALACKCYRIIKKEYDSAP